MKKKSLSTLGYIMEALNIQTVSMSRSIHVDASLVSKWKTGSRSLSTSSVYFDDIIDFILQESTKTIHQNLQDALRNLYPHEKLDDEIQLEKLLRQALSCSQANLNFPNPNLVSGLTNTISVLNYDGITGRKEAISKLIEYASNSSMPGELLFIDNEEFRWFLDDPVNAELFISSIQSLVHKGFHASFVIRYSSYKDRLIKLFDLCSPLIFHRNIDWYYHEYYDKTMIDFSFFVLNHAVSLLGFSTNSQNSSTLIFTDINIVMQHELMARQVMEHCKPIFSNFKLSKIHAVLHDVSRFRKRGTLYSYLPSPVFLFCDEALLREILQSNGVSEETIHYCININHQLRQLTHSHFSSTNPDNNAFIYIFQYEELIRRASKSTFTSNSLSLACKQTIHITAKQFASQLRKLAQSLMKHENLSIVLASKKDHIALPNINCWCKKDIFMVQMNADGLYLSDEYTIVNAASTKWERCICSVPVQRKNKNSVYHFLMELANTCDIN